MGVQWVWWVCTVSTTSMCLLLKLLSAMIGKMSNKDGPLPQDEMEGVEEEEWVSSVQCVSTTSAVRADKPFLL